MSEMFPKVVNAIKRAIAILGLAFPVVGVAENEAVLPAVKVDDKVITLGEYSAAWGRAIKQKYYHGKVPQAEIIALRREVGDDLVNRYLLSREAISRGFQPDKAATEKEIASYDTRYSEVAEWKTRRDQVLPALRKQLETDDLINQLKANVADISAPGNSKIQEYYEKYPEKFTIPSRVDVSVILLRVDPSSSPEVWNQYREEALGIVNSIRQGEDFAQLARLHSDDPSADKGGDLGELHLGMLIEEAQQAIDKLEPGEITEPVLLLEGLGIFRLNRNISSEMMPFSSVKERAGKLLVRELRQNAWDELINSLRGDSEITFYEKNYMPSS